MRKLICIICLAVLCMGMAACDKAPSDADNGTSTKDTSATTTENTLTATEQPVASDYETAKKAYALLEQAEELCIDGMDDIYNAWRFGIYEADDCSIDTIFTKLSYETSFSSSELETNGGYEALYLVYGDDNWQYCLWVVENCLEARGDFDEVDRLLVESKTAIQSISSDYEYYGDFKDYYAKVASYAEFFKETSGSFNQLVDTISDYENNIRTAKEAFKFDFE